MSSPEVDHAAASRRRARGPAERLMVAGVVESVAYDIVGEHHGPWMQARADITTLAELRAEVEAFTTGNPTVTWHVIARTTSAPPLPSRRPHLKYEEPRIWNRTDVKRT